MVLYLGIECKKLDKYQTASTIGCQVEAYVTGAETSPTGGPTMVLTSTIFYVALFCNQTFWSASQYRGSNSNYCVFFQRTTNIILKSKLIWIGSYHKSYRLDYSSPNFHTAGIWITYNLEVIGCLLHLGPSSEPSRQSLFPSHSLLSSMQRPLLQ